MIDPLLLELINLQLDGELDADDRAELQRGLESDPEALAMSEQLNRIADSLGRMAPESPPVGLHERIVKAVQPKATVLPFRERRTRQYVRYTMALAAGIAIAAVGLQFSGSSIPGLQTDQLVGTIGGQANVSGPVFAEVAVQAPGLTGSVGITPDNGRWLLVVNIASEQPVTVMASHADAAFGLKAYALENSSTGAMSTTPGRIEFVSQGAQRQVLVLAPDAGGPIRIRFEAQGKLLQEAVLDVPGPVSTK
jgi:hypothetical protein